MGDFFEALFGWVSVVTDPLSLLGLRSDQDAVSIED
jgi:hypothetical protein